MMGRIFQHVHLFSRQLIVHRNWLVSIDTHKPIANQFPPVLMMPLSLVKSDAFVARLHSRVHLVKV